MTQKNVINVKPLTVVTGINTGVYILFNSGIGSQQVLSPSAIRFSIPSDTDKTNFNKEPNIFWYYYSHFYSQLFGFPEGRRSDSF